MTRLISAAGLAVYALALSYAAFPEQENGSGLSLFVSAAVAAEAAPVEAGGAPAEGDPAGTPVAPERDASWDRDRDGMLVDDTPAPSPFGILNQV